MEVTIDGKKYIQKWVPVEEDHPVPVVPEEESKTNAMEDEIKKLREEMMSITKQWQKKNRQQERGDDALNELDVNSILESIANGGKRK